MKQDASDTLPLASPRSKDDWVKLWKRPSEKVLMEGDDVFPDIHQRQRHFVGVAVDTTIILHVYEKLQEGMRVKDLQQFFTDGVTSKEAAILNKSPLGNKQSPEEKAARSDARMKLLVKMSKEKRLLNRYNLVNQDDWNTNKQEAARHDESLKKDVSSPAGWIGRPIDPRIKALNEGEYDTARDPLKKGLTEYNTIMDPGPKTLPSIQGKKKQRAMEINELTDLNRLAILPLTPEYRDDFNKIMMLRFPPKKVTLEADEFNKVRQSFPGAAEATGPVEVLIPQVFVQPAKVFGHGYFSQMTFVAIDRAKGGGHGDMPTMNNNEAAIGEIKLAPMNTNEAEKKSGIVKGLTKDLFEPTLYTSKGMEKRRVVLTETYKQTRSAYQKRFPDIVREHPFPPPVRNDDSADHSSSYKDLYNKMLNFQRHLPDFVKESEETMKVIGDLTDMLKDPYLYVPEGTGIRRQGLEEKYGRIKMEYDALLVKNPAERSNPDFQLPLFIPPEESDNVSAYERLRDAVTALQNHVNISAITAESKPWRREYIETAVTQKLYLDAGKDRKSGDTALHSLFRDGVDKLPPRRATRADAMRALRCD